MLPLDYFAGVPELDLYKMYYLDGKKQKELAEFYGISQAGVSRALQKSCLKMRYAGRERGIR